MKRTIFAALAGFVVLSSMIGCRRLEDAYRSYETGKTGAPSISMATVQRSDGVASGDAEKMIAVARCSRESACAKIRGRDHRIPREQCEREVGQRVRIDLVAPACRDLIARDVLDECLGELGAEDCDRERLPATRISACQPKILCAPPH
jgi:hypothetical protein